MTLDDIIKESEDEMEHSHMPDPTEDKINKVQQEFLQGIRFLTFQSFRVQISVLDVKLPYTLLFNQITLEK